MRLGFVPALNPHAGGVFQYSHAIEAALGRIAAADPTLSLVSLRSAGTVARDGGESQAWSTAALLPPARGIRATLGRLIGEGPHRDALRKLRARVSDTAGAEGDADFTPRWRDDVGSWWRSVGIDLTVFPQPHPLAFESGVPFIVAVHDLQHRLQPEFPEVSANGEWARREYILRNCIARAERVLVDSETGKEHALRFYAEHGARADRIDVLPFLPSAPAMTGIPEARRREVRSSHGVPDSYVLYPAAFWAHKNHMRIVEALARLANEKGLRVHAVFCGARGDGGRDEEFAKVVQRATAGDIRDLIHTPGYVTDEELAALYAGATALVMPTFFGPTNIPVLEAWTHGCPVLTSDIEGIREQVGDAAILVDPRDVAAIAEGIARLVTDDGVRRALAERGRVRLAQYTPADHEARLGRSVNLARTSLGLSPAGAS
jgi:glycosyltransferase involved in cell wall biosynthesis